MLLDEVSKLRDQVLISNKDMFSPHLRCCLEPISQNKTIFIFQLLQFLDGRSKQLGNPNFSMKTQVGYFNSILWFLMFLVSFILAYMMAMSFRLWIRHAFP